MKKKLSFLVTMVLLFCTCVLLYAQKTADIHKTFPARERIQINTASGDVIVKVSPREEILVDIIYSGRAEGSFEPEFRESGNLLKIKEHWPGSGSGNVTWTITVPSKTEIEFSTASGDVTLEGLQKSIDGETASGDISIEDTKGDLELSTASGDISLENIQGESDLSTASGDIKGKGLTGRYEMSTASGNIKISEAEGSFELSCASGDVELDRVIFKESCSFSTASGDIEIGMAQSPMDDLEISTASGDITLDYNGNEIKGYIECTVEKNHGALVVPGSFGKQIELEKHGNTYIQSTFNRGDKPKIVLESSSGTIRVSN
jgi:DUF4097 and DUF4098 domain-containing protein YvlB